MTTRKILLGLDGSPGADAALEWCRQYATVLDAEVVAVHVIPILMFTGYRSADVVKGRTVEELHSTMERALDEWVAPLRAEGVPCRTLVRDDTVAAALDAIAVEEDCDLIVVGRRGHGGFAEFMLGSVPHALSHYAHRPLVVVPVLEHSAAP